MLIGHLVYATSICTCNMFVVETWILGYYQTPVIIILIDYNEYIALALMHICFIIMVICFIGWSLVCTTNQIGQLHIGRGLLYQSFYVAFFLQTIKSRKLRRNTTYCLLLGGVVCVSRHEYCSITFELLILHLLSENTYSRYNLWSISHSPLLFLDSKPHNM